MSQNCSVGKFLKEKQEVSEARTGTEYKKEGKTGTSGCQGPEDRNTGGLTETQMLELDEDWEIAISHKNHSTTQIKYSQTI